jgi:hypothetical protein
MKFKIKFKIKLSLYSASFTQFKDEINEINEINEIMK